MTKTDDLGGDPLVHLPQLLRVMAHDLLDLGLVAKAVGCPLADVVAYSVGTGIADAISAGSDNYTALDRIADALYHPQREKEPLLQTIAICVEER